MNFTDSDQEAAEGAEPLEPIYHRVSITFFRNPRIMNADLCKQL